MKLGVYLHGSSPFSPKETIIEYIDLVNRYEDAGVHSLWFADHLIRTPDPNKTGLFEAWSLIAGLARETTYIRFGTMVTPITFRHIGTFAKQLVTVDHLTEGRLIAGLGAGWDFKEYNMWGIPFPSTRDRLTKLEETVQALQKLWKEDSVTFDGEFIQLNDAYLNPKPIRPTIPILIGGGGEKVTLKLVAKYAQYSNFGGNQDQLKHKLSVLWDHMDDANRPRDEVKPTTNRAIILGKNQTEVDAGIDQYLDRFKEVGREPPSRESFDNNRLVGTVDEVVQQIGALEDLGIEKVVMTVNDDNTSSLITELMDSL